MTPEDHASRVLRNLRGDLLALPQAVRLRLWRAIAAEARQAADAARRMEEARTKGR